MPAKIYERHWTQANGNALSFPNSANGDSKCFALNFPHECVIQKIMCVQVVGTTGADFDLTLYNLPTANIAPSEAHGEATGIQESASIVPSGKPPTASPVITPVFPLIDTGIRL